MRNTLLLLSGLLCFWGYQMNVDENLTAMYEKRDNTEEVDRQLHILTAKVSKTYSDLFSGIQIMPWKGNVYIELPLDLSGEVKRITKNSATHDDKLLAIYRWVTTHIEYDNDYKIYNADQCYLERRGVCNAYSDLLVKMLTTAGIHAYKVTGYVKKGDGTNDGRHAWVMMEKGDGSFILGDPTWDAGYKDEEGRYYKPTLEWYGCAPEVMIHTHYPDYGRHQLLKEPVSREYYESLPMLRPSDITSTNKSPLRQQEG